MVQRTFFSLFFHLHFQCQTFDILFGLQMQISRKWQIEQTGLLPSYRNYYMLFRLAYLHLTLAHSKAQAQFGCKYLIKSDRVLLLLLSISNYYNVLSIGIFITYI